MNNQKQESKIKSDGSILEVHSIFKTIQGEGPFSGTPAVFIRLAGCNLQCPGCDTDYSSSRRLMLISSITGEVSSYQEHGLVVITGGEPFRQNIQPLISLLVSLNFFVQIETNGTIQPPLEIKYNTNISQRTGCYLVCSPKTPSIAKFVKWAAFKYVLNHNHVSDDGLPTSVLDMQPNKVARPDAYFKGQIYLSPEDSDSFKPIQPHDSFTNEKNIQACIDSCLKHGYILSLQIHKILGLQ